MNVKIDISNTVIRTERLLLRPWRHTDLKDFNEYASVEGVGQMAGWLPHKSIEESQAILNTFIENKKTFALEYEGKAIGSIGIEKYDEDGLPEFDGKGGRAIGYVLSKEYWGRGLMPEAVNAVIRYLFDSVKVDFLICCHYTDNDQSRRVQEKCGFTHYKRRRSRTSYGELKDGWISLLTRDAFYEKSR